MTKEQALRLADEVWAKDCGQLVHRNHTAAELMRAWADGMEESYEDRWLNQRLAKRFRAEADEVERGG